jgi:L-Ala-D/L-Glu epimerase
MAEVHGVGGALPAPVASAATRWERRDGVLLRLVDADGMVGVGEASPLPRYSFDTLAQARACLHGFPWDRVRVDVSADDVLVQVRDALLHVPPEVPSARFAVETALLDLVGQRLGRPLPRLLEPGMGEEPIPLCALVADAADAERAVRAGYATLKVKVGGPTPAEVARVLAVRDAAGDAVSLRIDGNRAWPEASWREGVAALADVRPAWIEEPVDAACVHDAVQRGYVPTVALAADESLRVPEDLERVRAGTAEGVYRAWVLKPMVLGGALACLDLAREARALGAAPVASHLFEGPVGFAATCALALAFGGSHAAGVAPHGALAAFGGHVPAGLRGALLHPDAQPGLGVRPHLASVGP